MSNVYSDGIASNDISVNDFINVARTVLEQVAEKSGEDISHLVTDQLTFIPEESVREHPDFSPFLSDDASVHMSICITTAADRTVKRFFTVHFPPGAVVVRSFPGLFAVVTVVTDSEKIH